MEINKREVVLVESAEKQAAESQVQELAECQLALVGGGIGSVILA